MRLKTKRLIGGAVLLLTIGFLFNHYLGPELRSAHEYLFPNVERSKAADNYRTLYEDQRANSPTELVDAAATRRINPNLLDDTIAALDWLTDQMLRQNQPPPVQMEMLSSKDFTIEFDRQVSSGLEQLEKSSGTVRLHFDDAAISCELQISSWQKSPLAKADIETNYASTECAGQMDQLNGRFELNGHAANNEGTLESVVIVGTLDDGIINGSLLFRGTKIELSSQ